MIATITVTAAHRGTGRAVVACGGLLTDYAVDREREHGVEIVVTRVVSGALRTGAVGDAIAELVAGAIRRGVGVERVDLRHGADGAVVAHSLSLVAA